MKRFLFIIMAAISCFPSETRKVHLLPSPAPGLVKVESEGTTGWIYPPHLPQPTATVTLYGEYANGRLIQMAYAQIKPGMTLMGFVPTR